MIVCHTGQGFSVVRTTWRTGWQRDRSGSSMPSPRMKRGWCSHPHRGAPPGARRGLSGQGPAPAGAACSEQAWLFWSGLASGWTRGTCCTRACLSERTSASGHGSSWSALPWMPLHQRPGVGTLCSVVLVGLALDAVLGILPPAWVDRAASGPRRGNRPERGGDGRLHRCRAGSRAA